MSQSVAAVDLVSLLEGSVGRECAERVVISAAQAIGLSVGRPWSREEAYRVLDMVADEDGLLGIAARFGKSSLFLMWSWQARASLASHSGQRAPQRILLGDCPGGSKASLKEGLRGGAYDDGVILNMLLPPSSKVAMCFSPRLSLQATVLFGIALCVAACGAAQSEHSSGFVAAETLAHDGESTSAALSPPLSSYCGDGRISPSEACDTGVAWAGSCPEGWGLCWQCEQGCESWTMITTSSDDGVSTSLRRGTVEALGIGHPPPACIERTGDNVVRRTFDERGRLTRFEGIGLTADWERDERGKLLHHRRGGTLYPLHVQRRRSRGDARVHPQHLR